MSSEIKVNKIIQEVSSPIHVVPIKWFRKVRSRSFKSGINVMLQDDDNATHELSSSSSIESVEINSVDDVVSEIIDQDDVRNYDKMQYEYDHEGTYKAINATLTLVDCDLGPTIKVISDQAYSFLNDHEILDLDPDYDVIHSNQEELLLERLVPLSVIDYASAGSDWGWHNLINLDNVNQDQTVKVYGLPTQYQVLGSGSKIFLFDVTPCVSNKIKIERDDIIEWINSLVNWNRQKVSEDLGLHEGFLDYIQNDLCGCQG